MGISHGTLKSSFEIYLPLMASYKTYLSRILPQSLFQINDINSINCQWYSPDISDYSQKDNKISNNEKNAYIP